MTNHSTPITFHLKLKRTWIDIIFFILLWGSVLFVPENVATYKGISLFFIIKITALVASLEFISFFSFHLLSRKRSLILQGFLGGFISSTAVFVQLNNDKRFMNVSEKLISEALLTAIISMLLECVLIIISLSTNLMWTTLFPFISMLIFILFFLLYQMKKNEKELASETNVESIDIDYLIVWKKVLTFTLCIGGLKILMLALQEFTNIPLIFATFIASIFEAHAILAVNVNSFTTQDQHSVFLIVLFGSLLSKIFFVLKGKVINQKKLVLIPIVVSFIMTVALFSIFNF